MISAKMSNVTKNSKRLAMRNHLALTRFLDFTNAHSPSVRRSDYDSNESFERAKQSALALQVKNDARLFDYDFVWTIPRDEAIAFAALVEAHSFRFTFQNFDRTKDTVDIRIGYSASETSKRIQKAYAHQANAAAKFAAIERAPSEPLIKPETINEDSELSEVKIA
jgi:hypothetical protein